MNWHSLPEHPLRRLFRGLVEHVFYSEVGMADPKTVEYLADLLMEFVHVDHIFALHDAAGRRIEGVAEMLTEADLGPAVSGAERERRIHRHIGDFTLFWTGVYPEGLRYLRHPMRKDHLVDYLQQGKRSYAIAGRMYSAEEDPPGDVLRRLSDNFEFCVYGLGEVRKGWERRDPDSFQRSRRLWRE
jgi:hypothetical protein